MPTANKMENEELEEFGVSTAREGSIFISGKIINAAVALLMLVFLARVLKPVDYGLYTIAIAFSTFLSMGGNFGIATALRKHLPSSSNAKEKGALIGSGYVVSGIISFALAVIGILLSGFIAAYVYKNPAIAPSIAMASILVFVSVLLNMSIAILVALKRSRKATNTVILYSTAELIFTILFVAIGYSVFGAIGGLVIGSLIGFAFSFVLIGNEVGFSSLSFSKAKAKELTAFSIPIFVSHISQNGTLSFGTMFAGVFALPYAIGNYGIAQKFGKFIELLLVSSTFVLLPTFSSAVSSDKFARKINSIYSNSIYYSILLLFPAVAYLASTSKPIVKLLFSSAYASAPFYLSAIAIGTAIGIIGNYAGTLLLGYGAAKRFMKYQILVISVELLSILVLVPFFGINGLLISLFAIGPVVLDAVYVYELKKSFSIGLPYAPLAKISIASVLSGIVMLSISLALNNSVLAILINFVALLLIYPILLGLFSALPESKLRFISKFGNSLPKFASSAINWYISYAEIFIKKQE